MFRKFNEQEIDLLKTLRTRKTNDGQPRVKGLLSADKKVRYDVKGNFIVAVVKVQNNIYTGVAKFNPEDKGFNQAIGEQLAFTRAVEGH